MGFTMQLEQISEDIKPVSQVVMLALAFLVGIIAGFGAVLFRGMIAVVHNFMFLREWSVMYDTNVHTPAGPWGWWIIFSPVIGAVVVAWLVKTFAPEAKGHGVPEVMYAIYFKKGIIRPVVAIVKSLASAISIGTGGSIGREGPIIQIGSAFGSTLGQLVKMPMRQRFILIAAGAGGGIAATFNAPLGGLAFAMELILVTINARSVLPVAIATVTATNIGRVFFGLSPAFPVEKLSEPAHVVASVFQLFVYVPFGVMMGFLCLLFVRSVYWCEDLFDALPGNYYSRHMLGMLMVGIMMYLFFIFSGHYYIQGVGYATIMDILSNILSNPWFLILLFICKFLATGLTLGSGASGGIFSPSLYLGAAAGSAYGLLINFIAPGLHVSPVAFAVAGMAAMVGGSTGAIFTAIIMIFEMTGDFKAVLPVMISVGITYAIRKYFSNASIYTLKILRRGEIVPEGLQVSIVGSQNAKYLMETDFKVLDVSQMDKALGSLVVFVKDQEIVGIQHDGVIEKTYVAVAPKASILEVLRLMHRKRTKIVLVFNNVNYPTRSSLVGVVTQDALIRSYMNSAELMEA